VRRPRSLYDVLNVSPQAEPVVIEAAYRALMKKYHPDQAVPGAAVPSDAAEINNAYAVLRDAARRGEYDHREWVRQQSVVLAQAQVPQAPPPPRWRAARLGGWIIAIGLGCGIGLTLAGSISVATPAPPRPTRVAEAPKAGPDPGLISREESVGNYIAAQAPRHVRPEIVPAREEAIAETAPSVTVLDTMKAPRAAPRLRARTPEPPAPKPAVEDEEFLEREGFIY
jgi:hypothetical protein